VRSRLSPCCTNAGREKLGHLDVHVPPRLHHTYLKSLHTISQTINPNLKVWRRWGLLAGKKNERAARQATALRRIRTEVWYGILKEVYVLQRVPHAPGRGHVRDGEIKINRQKVSPVVPLLTALVTRGLDCSFSLINDLWRLWGRSWISSRKHTSNKTSPDQE